MATLYIDNTNKTGDLTGADWTFTNGSTAVASAGNGTCQTDGLVAGDYVRANGGTQWYKVASVTNEDNFVITPAFQQATIAGIATINWQDVSVKNGTSIANAWVHPALYTTDTVRTAGDIGKMRANQTHVLAGLDLVADEDGTVAARIELKGCDSVDDPWSDASDAHVTFDFSDTSFQCSWIGDEYWQFKNIDFIQSADPNGALLFDNSYLIKVINCVFRDNAAFGIYLRSTPGFIIDSCSFYSNLSAGVFGYIGGGARIYNSVFNGGVATQNSGIYATYGSVFYLEDCDFGSTTAHNVASIRSTTSGASPIHARRCLFSDAVILSGIWPGTYLKSEDHNQVEGVHYSEYYNGTIKKETTEVRGGGALTSIKVTPNANCVANFPIMAMEWEEQAVPASEQTRGVAIKQGLADPTGFPTNVQLWLEAEYYNHATNDTVATAVSTATISVYNTWTWFPVTYTPAQVQKVRYRVWLGVKKSAEAYYIDNQLYDANPI